MAYIQSMLLLLTILWGVLPGQLSHMSTGIFALKQESSDMAMIVEIATLPEIDDTNEALQITKITVIDPAGTLKPHAKFLKYQLTLLDHNDTPIFQSRRLPFDLKGGAVTIPLADLPSPLMQRDTARRYQAIVTLMGPNNLEIASAPVTFVLPAREQPRLLTRYRPLIIGGLIALLMGGLGWHLRRRPWQPAVALTPYNPPTMRVTPHQAGLPHSADTLGTPGVRISVLQTPDPSQQWEQIITSFPCLIGRGDTAFVIGGDSSLSRRHAELTLQGTEVMITDLESANGMFINDTRQVPGRPIPLRGRMQVQIGHFTILEIEQLDPSTVSRR